MKNKDTLKLQVGNLVHDDLTYRMVKIGEINYCKKRKSVKVRVVDPLSKHYRNGWRYPWELVTYG